MHRFNVASDRAFPGDLCRVGEFSMSQVVDCGGFPKGGSDSYIHFGEVGKEKSSLRTPRVHCGPQRTEKGQNPLPPRLPTPSKDSVGSGTFAPETQAKCRELNSRKSTREDKSQK